jgi:hypothetical protein
MAILTGSKQFFPAGGDTARSTTAQTTLGSLAQDDAGNVYRYVKAGATIAAYDALKFQGSAAGWDDIRPTAGVSEVVVGAATAAFASGEYGYIIVSGVATVKVAVGTAAGSQLGSSATAGSLELLDGSDIVYRPAVALVTGVAAGSAVALL